MRIVIDLQGAQTENRHRHIGRCSIELAKRIALHLPKHETIIALNADFQNTIKYIREEFRGIVPKENIVVWEIPGPVAECDPENRRNRESAELIREAVLSNLNPDVVLITSLFEGYFDNGVTSIGRYNAGLPVAVVVHDQELVSNERGALSGGLLYTEFYLRKIGHIRRAQNILAMSSTVARNALRLLGKETRQVVAIGDISEKDQQTTPLQSCSWFPSNIVENAISALAGACFQQQGWGSGRAGVGPSRQRLAFVSPLPPVKSGISAYSAELLPELAQFYDIEVVVAQDDISDPYIRANFPVRSAEWFRINAYSFDRIVYHFGNSPFHEYMFHLLSEHPGLVVLHDFFLSDLQFYRGSRCSDDAAWARDLYDSHGYPAVRDRFLKEMPEDVVRRYPVNLGVLQGALGIIVHSEHSRELARKWYGEESAKGWAVIPHLRKPAFEIDRDSARARLGFEADDVLVCAFGHMGPTKLNDRLVDAWLASKVAKDGKTYLVFVGEEHHGNFGGRIEQKVQNNGAGNHINITGWADDTVFRDYLAAADIGVQLRADSRGETSGTVLDCMNYGLATIVNAHGSMAALDPTCVWMLPDEFCDADLVAALKVLAGNVDRRAELARRAQEYIRSWHSPHAAAEKYAEAIEDAYRSAARGLYGLSAHLRRTALHREERWRLANTLAKNFPPHPRRPQLLVDISVLAKVDLKTGVERVVRAVLREWLNNPPAGWQVEPVYAIESGTGYRYARRFVSRFLGIPETWSEDAVAEAWSGDVFMGLDFHPDGIRAQETHLSSWHNRGVGIWFLLHDLLPISMPEFFPKGADARHIRWLNAISSFDGVVCVSRSVADELRAWLHNERPQTGGALRVSWVHNGADIGQSVPTKGLPEEAEAVLARLETHRTFLMVGTVEPRKGHLQVIKTFEQLWREGLDVNLVVVGPEGWKPLPHAERRTIPMIVNTLRNHPELGRRLFWLEGISDQYLEKIYAASTCLIAASEGEGFGLPLIEAAQHGLPVLVRDIAIFREVAGQHATYFTGLGVDDLAPAIRAWLEQYDARSVPRSDGILSQTWAESAEKILECIGVLRATEDHSA